MLNGTSICYDVWNGIKFERSDQWQHQPSQNGIAWNLWR